MKIRINGIDDYLEITSGQMGLLNIQNPNLYLKIQKMFVFDKDCEDDNEIVFLEDLERIEKTIIYIQDSVSFSLNSKTLIENIIKKTSAFINTDIPSKNKETDLYKQLIEPLLEELNLLEIEYDYKEELDQSFYSKIPAISFKTNDTLDILEKVINIIKVYIKLLRKKVFVFNNTVSLLTTEELLLLNEFVKSSDVIVVFIDNLNIEDIKLKNNINIFDDYSSITIVKDNMI